MASVIKRALSTPVSDIARENSAGIATVTAVRVSPDLTIAKIYISVFGNNFPPARFIAKLEDKKYELRRLVGKAVRLRSTPDIKFYLDDTLDQIEHIQKIIDIAKEKDNQIKIESGSPGESVESDETIGS